MASKTALQAWPFLISTDATSGFVTIAAPQFMLTPDSTEWLRLVTDGEVTPDDAVNVRAIFGSTTGPLLLAYRIAVAPGAMLDRADEILYDQQGRRILLIEGVVIPTKTVTLNQFTMTAEDFDAVRAAYLAAFRALWQAQDRLPTQPTQAFPLGNQGQPLRVIPKSAVTLPLTPTQSTRDDAPPSSGDPTSFLLLLTIFAVTIVALLVLIVRLMAPHDG
jgi:hypothetical protein